MNIFHLRCLIVLFSLSIINPSASSSGHQSRDPKCIAVNSHHIYVCTDNPEATRRAVAAPPYKNEGSDGAKNVVASAFDADIGVEQRITGSEAEQLRIRNVLRRMYAYFEEEVLSRSEYEHVRGKCKNEHELCAFWTSVGECESNRGFMLENCAAACRLCLLASTNMLA